MANPANVGMDPWVVLPQERARYQQQFDSLKPVNGIVTGLQAKDLFIQSQLPPPILGRIWALSDTDADGKMNINEFSIACKLINLKLRGFEVPSSLPPSLVRSVQAFTSGGASPVAAVASHPVPTVAQPIPAIPKPIIPPMPTATSVQHKIGPPVPPMTTVPIGSGFAPAAGIPPPKPAPPMSYPTNPVVSSVTPVQLVQPITSVTAATGIPSIPVAPVLPVAPVPSVAPVAPIVPINTAPVPTAAFSMGQTMPMHPIATSVSSMVAGAPMVPVPPVAPIAAVAGGVVPTVTPPMTPLSLANVTMNGSIIHTPVSTSTPVSTTARPPSIDRVGSIDSQHSQHSTGTPQSLEWSVPHQSRLKYTQLFNTWDRTRSGFLTGPQARNILVQTQLPQAILAQIWALSDMDSDGKLGCEEFVLAMHLCDMVKAGEQLIAPLPYDLIPPSFRRQRQSSQSSQGAPDTADPLAGMPQTSFEDKRKENFEKGQAELERRRKSLLEIQRKEQEERDRKEREEAEKREKMRLEQERRRQSEIDQQLLRQREIEQQKEEERKRAQEQREAARKEMERQRQLEWENQKLQELQTQRQKEQDNVLKLKAKNQSLTIELNGLNDRVKELSQKICDTRVGVSSVKTTIDGMRTTRDEQLQEMSALKNKLREQNQKLLQVSQEKAKIDAKNKDQEAAKLAFANKQIVLKNMKDKIKDLEEQVKEKQSDIENSNKQLEELQTEMKNLLEDCKNLNIKFEEMKKKILDMRKSNNTRSYAADAWGDDAWGTSNTEVTAWPEEAPVEKAAEPIDTGAKKYRALYEFVARNQDEISFQPGDIIMVSPVQNAEPGWMAGEIRGHTGWFPESYVEPIDSAVSIGVAGDAFAHQDSLEKRTLEEIAEVPENVSEAGSVIGDGPPIEIITPQIGAGEPCNLSGTTLYQYRPNVDFHLSFSKGETVTIVEQQNEWCYGASSTGKMGWFPKSYVKIEVKEENKKEGLNEYYMSLYQYASNEPGDLHFNQAEVILVIKKDGDWWTGVIGDRTGIFPSNYVEKYDMPSQASEPKAAPKPEKVDEVPKAVAAKVKEEPQQKTAEELEEERAEAEDRAELPDFAAMAAQQYTRKGRKPDIVQVIAPYKATSKEQLDLQKGQLIMIRKKTDSGWWEGELQARGKKRQVGWFPASYVKVLTSNSNRSTPVSHKYADSPTGDPFQERVMALYPYSAQNTDELSFEKGDVITVISKDEESWWKGEMNGLTGVFPSNYVSPMFNSVISDYAYDNPMARLDSMEKKRQEHIKELIHTEQVYIHDMSLVSEVFEKPLISSKVLNADEVEKIFINWRDIIVCNDNFLRTLRIRRDNSEGGIVRMIGDILCENIPRMSVYVRFCSCQISAASYLQKLTETSPHFVEVVQKCQLDPRTKGMPLSSFLIKPMQRITRYPLIIGRILEYTRSDHPDKQYLQEALHKAEEFCSQVNEGVREKENSDRLEWLQTHVNCDGLEEQLVFNSLTNSLGPRKLLHYGILHKAKSGKELVAFLTNDFLLFAQPLKSMPSGQQFSFDRNENQKFKLYRKPIFLQDLTIFGDMEINGNMYSSFNGNNDNNSDNSRVLKLGDSKKFITLVAQSLNECTMWTRRIVEARKRFVENERSRLQRQRSRQAQFKACGRILVTVLEGINLKVHSGKCHAYCKVSMGSQEEQTSVVSGTDSPYWDKSMQFHVKDVYEDTLCITIFDKGYFSPDEFLGRSEVRVVDILRETQDTCGPVTKRLRLREVQKGDILLKLDFRIFGKT